MTLELGGTPKCKSLMARAMGIICIATAFVGCSPQQQMHVNNADLVIENVTVIDALEGERAGMDVILIAEKIHSIKPHQSNLDYVDAAIIDGTDRYLIPGLWDAHVHLTYTEGLDHEVFFPLAIAHGVTSLRDTGGHLDKLAPAQAAAAADPLSPDLYISGPLVDGPLRVYAGQTPFNPDISVGVASPLEAERMVDELAEAGVHFIKAYEMLSEPTFRALVARAKERGLPVAAHAPLSMTASDAALSGADDLQHLRNLELSCPPNADDLRAARRRMLAENDAPDPAALRSNIHRAQRAAAIASLEPEPCEDLISILTETRTIQTPTLMITRFLTHGAYANAEYRKTFDLVPSEIGNGWKARSMSFIKPSTDEDVLAHDAFMQSILPRLADAGVPIMAGTDAPIGFLTPGASLHYELYLLVEAGLTPLQALKAATMTPAMFFGLENDMGAVQQGMIADLVLLNENPLMDIRNVAAIELVVKNGRTIGREQLDELLTANAG